VDGRQEAIRTARAAELYAALLARVLVGVKERGNRIAELTAGGEKIAKRFKLRHDRDGIRWLAVPRSRSRTPLLMASVDDERRDGTYKNRILPQKIEFSER
jgi:hypothetical protein